jgi:proteasome lid subunit RPN8/RPN11
MNLQESLDFFKLQSMSCRVMEICGFLGEKDGEYTAKIVKNIHPDPKNFFSINPMEMLRFIQEHKMVAIFHSHITGDSSASDFDKINSENTIIPFLIYSLAEKKFSLYEPSDNKCNIEELKKLI